MAWTVAVGVTAATGAGAPARGAAGVGPATEQAARFPVVTVTEALELSSQRTDAPSGRAPRGLDSLGAALLTHPASAPTHYLFRVPIRVSDPPASLKRFEVHCVVYFNGVTIGETAVPFEAGAGGFANTVPVPVTVTHVSVRPEKANRYVCGLMAWLGGSLQPAEAIFAAPGESTPHLFGARAGAPFRLSVTGTLAPRAATH